MVSHIVPTERHVDVRTQTPALSLLRAQLVDAASIGWTPWLDTSELTIVAPNRARPR